MHYGLKLIGVFMNILLKSLFFVSFTFSICAAEVDQFTARSIPLEDGSDMINQRANEFLGQALTNLNSEGKCSSDHASEKKLYKELQKYFENHISGELVKEMLYTDKYPKMVLPIEKSIYRNWTKKNGFLLANRIGKNNPYAIYPEVRIGDVRVGVDKLEHFYGMGVRHFRELYFHNLSLTSILKMDYFIERNVLGGQFIETGVMSYGDIAANINGIRFWNSMLQKHEDILGSQYHFGPYVICENNQWKINPEKKIDMRDYIDDSMDEGINCSTFANKKGVDIFKAALFDLGLTRSSNESACPIDAGKLENLKNKYDVIVDSENKKTFANWILNTTSSRVRD